MNKDDREITALIIDNTMRELTLLMVDPSSRLTQDETALIRARIARLERRRKRLRRAPWPARWILRWRALTSGRS